MTSASLENEDIILKLSKSEALVLFEWLSRNWEQTQWKELSFSDPAERQLLMWLENDLKKILVEPFDEKYKEIITKCYRNVVPNPEDWVA